MFFLYGINDFICENFKRLVLPGCSIYYFDINLDYFSIKEDFKTVNTKKK